LQNVRFITPKNKEVVFSMTPPFIFEKISGIGAEDIQQITTEAPGQNGNMLIGQYTSDREITVYIHIKGDTVKSMYENRQNLITLLNPELYGDGDLGRIEYTNDTGTWWIPAAVKRGPQEYAKAGSYFKSIPLVFYCPDALWRDLIPEFAKMAYLGGGMRFPLRMGAVKFGSIGYKTTILNRGNRRAPLIIDISGPATRPEVLKVSTGEYIRVKRTLYAGDNLHIDATPGNRAVTIRRAAGTTETAIGYIDLSSEWFQLDPGENQLQYLSGDDTQTAEIMLSSYGRYGGM
jgi:phage-related protein